MSGSSALPTVPALRFQSAGDESTKFALRLTQARERVVVRITGGCGLMTNEDAQGLVGLYRDAFAGYCGALLFGGSRMVSREDHNVVVPGITEVVAHIREHCPESIALGVVPRMEEFKLTDFGLVVSDDLKQPYVTIVHPNQDLCLIVQRSADEEESWDAEWRECMNITANLRDHAGWQSLLVAYNGGSVTEREILATAKRGWPVLLINGSGRTSERYANDIAFLAQYPNVHVANNNVTSFRKQLIALGILRSTPPSVTGVLSPTCVEERPRRTSSTDQ